MANKQRISSGFPFPVLVNETARKQRTVGGAVINETISAGGGGGGSAVAAAASRATQIIGGVFK